jgi:hypothetical protein
VARLLEISWRETDLPIEEREGYGTTYLPLSALAKTAAGGIVWDSDGKATKPVLVYFYSGSTDDEKLEKAESKMFGNDDLAVATKFFSCLRIDVDQIENQEIRKRYAPKTPTFYVLDGAGKTLKKRTGNLSSKAIVSELVKAYKSVYSDNLSKRIKTFNKFLNRLEKLADKIAVLDLKITEQDAAIAKRDTPRKRKKLAGFKLQQVTNRAEMVKMEQERDMLLAPPASGRKTVALSR